MPARTTTIVGLPLRFWLLTVGMVGTILVLRFGLRTTERFAADVGAIGAYITAIGTLYGILATFTIYVVWTQFNDAQGAAEAEANELLDLFRYAVYLRDQKVLDFVQEAVKEYSAAVVREEWPAMSSGVSSPQTVERFEGVFRAVHSVRFDDERDATAWAEMIRKFESVSDARSKRLELAAAKVPSLLQALLYLVSLSLVIGFFLLSVSNDFLAVAVTMATTAVVFLAIEVVEDLDDPFGGQWALSPAAFEGLARRVTAVREAH